MELNLNDVIDRRGTDSVKWDLRTDGDSGNTASAAGDGVSSDGSPADNLLPMWVADMDFPVPAVVQQALAERIRHPVFGYSLLSDELRSAYAGWQMRRNKWHLDPDWLVYAPGVMPAIRSAILSVTEPGDEIIVQPPVYYPFFDAVKDNGRALVLNPLVERPLEGGAPALTYEMDLDHFRSVITPRTKMLLLCSPHNPVGRVWSKGELESLARICLQNDITVISDEIHSDLIRDSHTFVPFASLSGDAARASITSVSPTKTFNIAGLSSSFLIVPDRELRRSVSAGLHQLGMDLPNVLSLTAASAAYAGGEQWLAEVLRYLNATYSWFEVQMAERFPRIGFAALEGTYLAWLDMRRIMSEAGISDATLRKTLLDAGRLWLSHGPRFGKGGSGFQRMNLACPRSTIEDGLDRLQRALEALA